MKISIADGRGALWQWDTGRRLRVGSGVEQIHYQNKCFGRSVDVDVGDDGTAIIPDELLQDCHTLTAYAYVTDDTGAYTMVQQDFVVHKRAKPAGYVYTPTDQMTLRTIQRQIGDLADLTTEAKENLVAAINEVARMGGRMSLRVANGYIQYSTDAEARRRNETPWTREINYLNAYPGATFRDKVVNFMVSCGITIEKINAFRAAMIDGTPETVTADIATYSITKTLTDVTVSNGAASVQQYSRS